MCEDDIFGLRRSILLIIALATLVGSFGAYKALGGGSTKVAGTFQVPSATVGRTERSEVPAIAHLGSPVFTSAEAPLRGIKTELTPIEQIQVGDRVLAESPNGEENTAFGSEIIPSAWRKLTLRAPKRDGTMAEVVLLRPLTWLNEQRGDVGGTVFISVPECGIDGNAQVLGIDPCPEIPSGAGRVVTGTFRHQAASTINLTIPGEPKPIGCTGNHPFWSEDRQDFVRADSLQPGETLRTATGLTNVESTTTVPGQTYVYNLEVHGAHVYHVGTSGVLVHNGNDDCLKIVVNLGGKGEFPGAINLNRLQGGNLVPEHLIPNLIQGDMAQTPFRTGSIDLIVGNRMPFEHGQWASSVADEMYRVLKPGGSARFFSTSAGINQWRAYLEAAGFNQILLDGMHIIATR